MALMHSQFILSGNVVDRQMRQLAELWTVGLSVTVGTGVCGEAAMSSFVDGDWQDFPKDGWIALSSAAKTEYFTFSH